MNAQANILYVMGVMGHFVGDLAQPLHTTKHFNGWVGENPKGYTAARGLHSWVDGGIIAKARIRAPQLLPRIAPAHVIPMGSRADGRDPMFVAVLERTRLHRTVPDALLAPDEDPNVIWVTGPSKTADVEGILIEGVHGPGEQAVLLV
jgi:hypothetical protein